MTITEEEKLCEECESEVIDCLPDEHGPKVRDLRAAARYFQHSEKKADV